MKLLAPGIILAQPGYCRHLRELPRLLPIKGRNGAPEYFLNLDV